MKNTGWIIIALFILAFSIPIHSQSSVKKQYLVVLSLDGFRWDYNTLAPTPNLDYIKKHGIKAERMIPSYPSKTFPNHYTLATGLYPDNHGIVSNTFKDTESDRIYRIGDRSVVTDAHFYGGEPIWNTAIKQGKKANILFWVGSEAPIQNMRPTEWLTYDHNLSYPKRIDKVIEWLSLPENKRPELIMWYFDQPDSDGHKFGPKSAEMKAEIIRLDSLIGVFITKAKALSYFEQINFVFVSDHGMAEISKEKTVYLNDLIGGLYDMALGGNPSWSIKPKEGMDSLIFEKLKANPNISVWRKSEVPLRFHYGKNARIFDIVVSANEGWSLELKYNPNAYMEGTHGYDNEFTDMHAIFYAMGPAFKRNYVQKPFYNVDFYSIMCKVLNLEPAKTDGSLKAVNGMFRK